MNKVIKFLIFSDFALITGIGFANPVFAIFLTNQIKGGNAKVAGFAAAIYWFVESLVAVPLARQMDKNHGEKDDFWYIVAGNVLVGLAAIGFIFARLPWHIYVLQGIYALGIGMNIPAYTAIFTRHIDKGKEAFDWSVRSALAGAGAGVAGALGGLIVTNFSFVILFLLVALLAFSGALVPFVVKKHMFDANAQAPRLPISKDGF